jgi:hypothetical protein
MDLNQLAPFLIFGVIAALVIGSIIFSRIQARKRTEALQTIASQLGFTFAGVERDHHPATPDLTTALFNRGSSRKFSNALMGSFAGLTTSIFDYRYATGSGKNRHTYCQTVAAFSQKLWLPEFECRPETFLDRIANQFGYHDIDFDSFPVFSRRFLLRGPSEEGIRKLFSPALIQFLEMLPGDARWTIEGNSCTLILYHSDSTVPPDLDSYRSFLDRTSEIAKTFFSSPEGLSQPVR